MCGRTDLKFIYLSEAYNAFARALMLEKPLTKEEKQIALLNAIIEADGFEPCHFSPICEFYQVGVCVLYGPCLESDYKFLCY